MVKQKRNSKRYYFISCHNFMLGNKKREYDLRTFGVVRDGVLTIVASIAFCFCWSGLVWSYFYLFRVWVYMIYILQFA